MYFFYTKKLLEQKKACMKWAIFLGTGLSKKLCGPALPKSKITPQV